MDDPIRTPPPWGEQEFAAVLQSMVADCAPRVFAVVQEFGERVDAEIAAWGMAFDERAEVVTVDGRMRMRTRSLDNALRAFAWGDEITARLVWVKPDAATPDVGAIGVET